MIGGKLYDFDYSGVTKDRWGQTLNPFMKGLDVVLAQKLQRDQQEAYQQGLASLSSPKLDAEDIEVITALQGGQAPEGISSLTTPQVSQAQGGLADLSAPQRRQFAITPEMQQRAVAIDYLTGSQPGTALNQLMGQYKDLVASADEKAIEDYRAERAYQDTRADKAKAEAWKEREYADLKKKEERGIMFSDEERARKQREEERSIAKEERDIEKQKREERIKSLEKLSNVIEVDDKGNITNSEKAKEIFANRARELEPETFRELSDDDVLKTLKKYGSAKSGLTFAERWALKQLDIQGRSDLEEQKAKNRREDLQIKLANSKQNLEKLEAEAKANSDADILSVLNAEIEEWYPESMAERGLDYISNKVGLSTPYSRNVNQVNSILQTKIASINQDKRFTDAEAKRIIDKFGLKVNDDLQSAKMKLRNLERYIRPGISKEDARAELEKDGLADSKSAPVKKKEQSVKNKKLTDADLDKLWND